MAQLFDKGKFNEIEDLYRKLKSKFKDYFYIEIQRHGDPNELGFEKFNLSKSLDLEIQKLAGELLTGRGAGTDVIVASAKAYLNAVNRYMSSESRKARKKD